MAKDAIHLLVSLDENYVGPLRVMLRSLWTSNFQEIFHIWLLHSSIPEGKLQELEEYCKAHRMTFTAIAVDRSVFERAPVSKQYPQEMYYRLLAPLLLPDHLKRILYLDPDILVLNRVRPLWELPLGEQVFAAASHSGAFEIIHDVNQVRLGSEGDYFNTGVLLMDLEKARTAVQAEAVFDCVRQQGDKLILPDQDVFNLLYGSCTLQIEDNIWNYDARYFAAYRLKSEGRCTMDWVMKNTVFLHFCGRQKPWKPNCFNRFAALYKHYMNLVLLEQQSQ